MKLIEQTFDNIGKAITSLAAVIFALLMTITGMIFFSHTLFIQVFPGSMATWEKLVATWLMALGWEFTVLLTTCNTRHINKHIPMLMAIASGIIVLFFIQAFDSSQTPLIIAQRWFVGLLAASINYIYAELFYAKWKERSEHQQLPTKLVEHERTIARLQSELVEARANVDQTRSELDQFRSVLVERERIVDELKKFKAKVERDLTCPHCKEIQDSYGVLQAHKGHCDNNPKKRKGKAVNGTPASSEEYK